MTPQQRGVLNYWLSVAVLTLAYEVTAYARKGYAATISAVMLDWATRYPWLVVLWALATLLIFWHVSYGFWPFAGE